MLSTTLPFLCDHLTLGELQRTRHAIGRSAPSLTRDQVAIFSSTAGYKSTRMSLDELCARVAATGRCSECGTPTSRRALRLNMERVSVCSVCQADQGGFMQMATRDDAKLCFARSGLRNSRHLFTLLQIAKRSPQGRHYFWMCELKTLICNGGKKL